MTQTIRPFAIDGVLVALTVALTFLAQPPAAIDETTAVGGMLLATAGVQGPAATVGPVSVAGAVDRTRILQGSDGTVRVELKITGERRPKAKMPRTPTDVVVVLDRSGSMDGEKIRWARSAAQELIGMLSTEDRFSLVTYSNRASVAIPFAVARPELRHEWSRTVGYIEAGGSTNISSALDVADAILDEHRTPGRAARVVLISDGLPTAGDTSTEGLVSRARRALTDEYVLSAVGVGEDFNEHLMTSIADAGTGNFYYLESGTQLASVFADEFESSREQIAGGLKVHLTPGPGVRVIDAAGYPLYADGDRMWFAPGAMFAGQERTVWVTLQAPTGAVGDRRLADIQVSYADGEGNKRSVDIAALPAIACVENPEEYARGIDKNKWEESQVKDTWSAVRQRVAREVQLGNRDAALEELNAYKADTARLNAVVGSAAVDANLMDVDDLEETVEQAFDGDQREQKRKRNRYSKDERLDALDTRRSGAKR